MITPQKPDLDEAVALCELRRDTLYRELLAFEDEHGEVHPSFVPKKRHLLELAAAHNPLASAIVERRILRSDHALLVGHPFNGQPVTCFGVHEILRKTRFDRDFADGCSPGVLMLGDERVTHDQLLGWYQELVPNLNLRRVYDRAFLLENPAVAPVLAGIVTAGIVASDGEGRWLHMIEAGIIGAVVCWAVLYGLSRSKYGRQLGQTAPWNSSLYVDLNLALLREAPEELHLASRARIARPQLAAWKLKSRYYPLAQRIINGTSRGVLALAKAR